MLELILLTEFSRIEVKFAVAWIPQSSLSEVAAIRLSGLQSLQQLLKLPPEWSSLNLFLSVFHSSSIHRFRSSPFSLASAPLLDLVLYLTSCQVPIFLDLFAAVYTGGYSCSLKLFLPWFPWQHMTPSQTSLKVPPSPPDPSMSVLTSLLILLSLSQ